MTENDYLIAWGLYAFAALGCLLVWMRMTRWMWRWLREPLRLLMAVLLFCPTIVDPVKDKVAPALAIVALDVLFKVGNNVWRAASDLLMYSMIAFGIYLIFVLIRFPIERAANARKERAAAAKPPPWPMSRRTCRRLAWPVMTVTVARPCRATPAFANRTAPVTGPAP